MPATTTLTSWDFRTKHVEHDIGAADFVTSESVLVLTSPISAYSQAAVNSAIAVGLAQDIQFNQQRQATQVFEIGSRRKYTFSSGRTQGQLTLSRILFDGTSLLKAVVRRNQGTVSGGNAAQANPVEDVSDLAGYGDFYINLGSTLFSRPVGIIMILRDVENHNVGAMFFQEAYIVSHAMSISSNQPFVGENVSILFEGIFPLQHRAGAVPSTNGNGNTGDPRDTP